MSRIDYLILHVITGIMLDPKEIAGLMEDLFLGSQWSIILGYRRLSVKFLFSVVLISFCLFSISYSLLSLLPKALETVIC